MTKYRTGLVLGKFMPIHKGHEALIQHALSLCEKVVVLVCSNSNEPISGELRYSWVIELFQKTRVFPVHFEYNEKLLSASSEPSDEVSKKWAEAIRKLNINPNVFVSSELYGPMVAKHLGIASETFDLERAAISISATEVRSNPYRHWDMISQPVRDYYFKKVVIAGTESTGKTELAKNLALHFNSDWVHEVGRDIVTDITKCTRDDLNQVAYLHSRNILLKSQKRNKILFLDTDVNITKSYHQFLFQKEMQIDGWMKWANHSDLYLYLEPDAPFIQDGTRMPFEDRLRLDFSHKRQFEKAGIQYKSIGGSDWKERQEKALDIIYKELHLSKD